MTTRPSSSLRGNQATSGVLLDSISRPLQLGPEIGRGGEGSVYQIAGDDSLVAKVYHKRPLPPDQVAKLQAMAAHWTKELEVISAWPRSLLYDPSSRTPSGILMSRMAGARQLHELYGTTNRKRHFPDVGWHHLVLAARNTAAAFQTMHASGIVVGDVNQGNLLVDDKMCVRMIDCDSFQITHSGQTFVCPVGTPHFTPPELQMVKLREVTRSPNHDRFGLAVLIFHLLFVGRHPFAGRFRGPSDITIERAIAEGRFAFSKHRSETLMEPPPASLLLDDLPPAIGQLFESALRHVVGRDPERPTPAMWVEQLDALIRMRKVCNYDAMHVYYGPIGDCPWCRIEDSGGPSFFVSSGSAVSADRLTALSAKVDELTEVEFPELPSDRLKLPTMPKPRRGEAKLKKSPFDAAALALPAAWATAVAGVYLGAAARAGASPAVGITLVAAGAAISIALGAALVVSKAARTRRKVFSENQATLAAGREKLARRADVVAAQHFQRAGLFKQTRDDLQTQIVHYRAGKDQIKNVVAQYRELKKEEFLRAFSIRDNIRAIGGLSSSQAALLESYGVDSANDVDRMRLFGIPSIDADAVLELLQWREECERQFVFTPEHGVALDDLLASNEVAIRRFKIAQARKILSSAKQLQSQAENGRLDLEYALKGFDGAAEKWTAAAQQVADQEYARFRAERWINQSPRRIFALAVGIPLASAVALWSLL